MRTYVGMFACRICKAAGTIDSRCIINTSDTPRFCPWCGHNIEHAIADAIERDLGKSSV